MNYSRRELYAAGEPLGECITRKRVDGRVLCGGGGGGGSTTATTYTSNVPEYAEKPFMDLVGQASALSQTPYQPYTGERIAQYTPLQQNAFNLAGNMQVSPYLQQAADMAGAGAQFQPGQFNFSSVAPGQVGTQSFLDNNAAQNFMSPYMQNVVDATKRETLRDDDILRQSRQAQAVNAGAFGGSRQAIMEAEAQRNLGTRLSDIQTTGLQSAFDRAQNQFNTEQQARLQANLANQQTGMQAGLANQQAGLETQRMREQSRQFGADLGMQGAGLLGQLGQNQFSQLSDIIGMQSQLGGDQQKLIQDVLSQQYGDFLAQQNYPYQQLGFLADVLRGAPGSTRTVYQPTAQPSSFQTVAGLGSLFAGMGGMKKGGEVKKPKAGLAEAALSKM